MEVVLITSRRGKRWVIPKGLVEREMGEGLSAANEAWEEAGLRGEISADAIGHYHYNKWGANCAVAVYLMRVEVVLDEWPECSWRKRVWLSTQRAAERVDEPALASLLRAAPRLVTTTEWRAISE
jgi:8-oxo-dGTP pyrophosphatase MutT (NUDIX family)